MSISFLARLMLVYAPGSQDSEVLHMSQSVSGLQSKFSDQNPLLLDPSDLILTKQLDACTCPQILVVDDDVFNINALQSILIGFGYLSDSAYNGQQAIKKVLNRQGTFCGDGCYGQYKLIFMDCNMPLLDGFQATIELTEMMKQKRIFKQTIIGCTALVQSHEQQRAISVGMVECCTKPLDRSKIDQLLKVFLKNDL